MPESILVTGASGITIDETLAGRAISLSIGLWRRGNFASLASHGHEAIDNDGMRVWRMQCGVIRDVDVVDRQHCLPPFLPLRKANDPENVLPLLSRGIWQARAHLSIQPLCHSSR
jgi:hypothetical protein